MVPITATRIVPVSVNAAASAAVVEAATHILEFAASDVFLQVTEAKSESKQRNCAGENDSDTSDEDYSCVAEHRCHVRQY